MRALAEYPLVSPLLTTVKKYERPLSAVSMVAGFIFDNYYFDRVDHPATQIVLAAYLALAIVSIVLIHYAAARAVSVRSVRSTCAERSEIVSHA